jgi:hypothetical protein
MTLRPKATMPPQLSRPALRTYLQGTETRGYPTLDELGSFYSTETDEGGLQFYYNAALFPRAERLYQDVSQTGYSIWGYLSPSQKQALLAKGTVRFGDLDRHAQAILTEKILFTNSDYPGGLAIGGELAELSAEHSLTRLPPEVFPNGIPADAELSGKTLLTSQVLVGTMSSGQSVGWSNTWPIRSVASMTSEANQNGKNPISKDSEFWPGFVLDVHLHLDLAGGYSYEMKLKENRFDLRTPATDYDHLPADYRAGS